LEEILARPSKRSEDRGTSRYSVLIQNYQEHGSHSIEKSNEGTDKEILNFKDLVDDKAYQLHIHKDLASNHKVVSEISVFIELNVDEFCKPMRQVPNAFS
jgi:hypothetical protein